MRTALTAYGQPSDREKLEVLAGQKNLSSSQYIIQKIRDEYERLFGDTPPKFFIKNDE